MGLDGKKPQWLTFDCYGTLVQWDEGLLDIVNAIVADHGDTVVDAQQFLARFDLQENVVKRSLPHKSFRMVASFALRRTMADFNLQCTPQDVTRLTDSIAAMRPFPETVAVLAELKSMGFALAVISNTDDDIIEGNIAQMDGTVDRVLTAQQAQAYKPSAQIFNYAHRELDVTTADIVHICASPHLDLAAARDIGFRCIWINRGTGRKPLPDYTPDAECATLEPVPRLLRETRWSE